MATLTRNEVEEVALLARLHLEPDEIERMQHELGAILEHFGALAAVDTQGVAPMTHAVGVDLALRPDIPAVSLETADALRAAPRCDGDLIVVPAIISSGSES
jgi:aspartyl-tRNA(Asn)/glutamyl-tRNA(Gln) amidotransferase subunit C